MRKVIVLMALSVMVAGGLAIAQEGDTETEQPVSGERIREIRERIRNAILLPRTAEESREAGATEERVREVLQTARTRRLPADEARVILVTENEELRRGGDPGNFGAAVQRMKENGLRGRELAAAIHAEQIARGMKKPKQGAHGKGHSKGQGTEKFEKEDSLEPKREPKQKGSPKKKGKKR